jgi:hypothetical protein
MFSSSARLSGSLVGCENPWFVCGNHGSHGISQDFRWFQWDSRKDLKWF